MPSYAPHLGHYNDIIMSAMASQITSLTIVYWSVCSRADQRKHKSFASLPFVRGIHRWQVNSPHKGPVTRKMFPIDDVIMSWSYAVAGTHEDLGLICSWLQRARSGECFGIWFHWLFRFLFHPVVQLIIRDHNGKLFIRFTWGLMTLNSDELGHYWFMCWLGTSLAPSHNLIQWWLSVKVIHKEYSRFLNKFFPTPCLYHELNMIIHTSYINI